MLDNEKCIMKNYDFNLDKDCICTRRLHDLYTPSMTLHILEISYNVQSVSKPKLNDNRIVFNDNRIVFRW